VTALADDRQTPAQEVELKGYLVAASTTIYKGGMVAVNDAGHLVMASDAANLRVVGVADERVDNSAGSAGDKKCRVRSGRAFDFNATAITQAMVGDLMFVVDDNTFDDCSSTSRRHVESSTFPLVVSARLVSQLRRMMRPKLQWLTTS